MLEENLFVSQVPIHDCSFGLILLHPFGNEHNDWPICIYEPNLWMQWLKCHWVGGLRKYQSLQNYKRFHGCLQKQIILWKITNSIDNSVHFWFGVYHREGFFPNTVRCNWPKKSNSFSSFLRSYRHVNAITGDSAQQLDDNNDGRIDCRSFW